jgi:glycosyltransferase involved in cell wall biosynthesis
VERSPPTPALVSHERSVSEPLRILQVVPHFSPEVRTGGVVPFVERLSKELRELGHDVLVITTRPGRSLDRLWGAPTSTPGEVRAFPRLIEAGHGVSVSLAREVRRLVAGRDVLHLHGIFSVATTMFARAASQLGRPYLASPHGACMPIAMRHHGVRKRLYWSLLERQNLDRAASIHVASAEEGAAVRALVAGARIVQVPPGIDAPPPSSAFARAPGRVLYLGRLHPIKGLDLLLRAMGLAARTMPEVELVVAGLAPDHVRTRLERSARVDCPSVKITFAGFVDGPEKARLLAEASVFALTSHSESFGHAVLEALAHGTPVVVTERAPWRRVEDAGAGRVVKHDAPSIAAGLIDVLGDAERWPRRSAAAREVASSFDWRTTAARLAESYARAAGRSEP